MLLNPFGVDISSGVETNGDKDYEKIKEFIRKVRELS
jgi:phosphoribosylanthranilate isomerase